MLVLSRKVGQRLRIGETWVTITAVRGHSVRVGVEAPDHVGVFREEVWLQLDEEAARRGGRLPDDRAA